MTIACVLLSFGFKTLIFVLWRFFCLSVYMYPPLFQVWILALCPSFVLPWPCPWSVWQESGWPSSSQRVYLHLPWLTSSLLYHSSSWWCDTHKTSFKLYSRIISILTILIHLFPLHHPVLGFWWLSCQSQCHAELALLAEMDQYLQIWTERKLWK